MIFSLNGVDYTIKQSFRALMQFEQMTNKAASELNTTISDLLALLFCMIAANNKETFLFTYDDFLDLIDENPDAINQFTKYLEAVADKEVKKKR